MAFETTLPTEDPLLSLSREMIYLRRDFSRQSQQIEQLATLLRKFVTGDVAPVQAVPRLPQPFIGRQQIDPAMVRRVIRRRQDRHKHFPANLFADPAWDMLLDLAAAKAERKRVSITSLCLASGVPMTTALRWLSVLADKKLIERKEDPADGRRVFVELTDDAFAAMARYFNSLDGDDAPSE